MADSSPTNMSLADQIMRQYVKGVFNQLYQDFLPNGELATILTEDIIIREFDEEEEEDTSFKLELPEDKALVDFIRQDAKIIFATAVICELGGNILYRAMRRFKEHDFQDSKLPLAYTTPEQISTLPYFKAKYWTTVKKRNFLQEQFVFLAPIFSVSNLRLNLEPRHIFPFTWVSNEAKEGTFSQVYQVTIHPSHQDITGAGEKANVAIKEIKGLGSTDEQEKVNKEWEAEAKALAELSALNHDNIVQRIAAITQGNKRYFMFQWADGGTLRELWQALPNGTGKKPKLDTGFVEEVIIQFRGLADALYKLHKFKGGSYRHGDLKPENILVFKNNSRIGVLKIADMGLAKHHAIATHLRDASTSTRYGTVRYEPPEVITQGLSQEGRSRLYDVWSIGCIALELIVWLLYGYDELAKFNEGLKTTITDSSPYYEIDRDSKIASVHRSVRACIDHISKDPECSGNTALKDLLDIIETKLLVVPLPERRNSAVQLSEMSEATNHVVVTPTDMSQRNDNRPPKLSRASARVLRDELDNIIGKGRSDKSYWFTGKSRESLKGPSAYVVPAIMTNGLLSPDSAFNVVVERIRESPIPGLSAQLFPSPRQNVSIFNY